MSNVRTWITVADDTSGGKDIVLAIGNWLLPTEKVERRTSKVERANVDHGGGGYLRRKGYRTGNWQLATAYYGNVSAEVLAEEKGCPLSENAGNRNEGEHQLARLSREHIENR